MTTQGPLNCGTAADDATVGTAAWTNPTNAQGACDTTNTTAVTGRTATACAAITSHYLKATNFGFTIPNNATIKGIQITVRKKALDNTACVSSGGGTGNTVDNSVKIVKGGVIGGTEKANASTKWALALTDATYGTASDLWGLTWTPADINASNFGVVISGVSNTEEQGSTTNIFIDCFTITITYTAGAATLSFPAAGLGNFFFLLLKHFLKPKPRLITQTRNPCGCV